MGEKIQRPDIPRWMTVTLTDDALSLRGRHRTPWGDALFTVAFYLFAVVALLLLGFLIAMRSVPWGLTALSALLWLIGLGFVARLALISPGGWLLGTTTMVEFTRDGRVRVPSGRFRRMTDYRPADTYQVAFGVVEPEELKRVRSSRKENWLHEWQRRLWANAGLLEFRFGADQVPVATFTRRRQAEEFVAACNWAKSEIEGLQDVDETPLPIV